MAPRQKTAPAERECEREGEEQPNEKNWRFLNGKSHFSDIPVADHDRH
jgi:hypothetical protein